uniref:Pentraxin family member n=1 Tax=Neogobius melanostomus TaxID=47308 RepID=A0A8C6SUG3_9GOBI
MRFLVCLMFLVSNAAAVQDLSGKMLLFPQQTDTAHVRLTPLKTSIGAATVCHRSFTNLKRDHNLFSMSSQSFDNEFLLFYDFTNNEMEVHVKNQKAEYGGLDYKPNTWHSLCTTWDSGSGLVQLWFNGRPLIKNYLSAQSNLTDNPIIILGQEQDSHGGRFNIKQCFLGMMTDVHMWDYVLSACEIEKYVSELSFTPGNVLNWAALEFEIFERVLIDNKQCTVSKLSIVGWECLSNIYLII